MISPTSATSSVASSSSPLEEEEIQLGRDGILGQQGDCLSSSKLDWLESVSGSSFQRGEYLFWVTSTVVDHHYEDKLQEEVVF